MQSVTGRFHRPDLALAARHLLDRMGIRIHRAKTEPLRAREAPPRDDSEPSETGADLMARIEMDVFGHP